MGSTQSAAHKKFFECAWAGPIGHILDVVNLDVVNLKFSCDTAMIG